MAIYTYYGNKDEKEDGTAVLEVASGLIPIGQSGDLTAAEYNYLSRKYILEPGVDPWSRQDFIWRQRNIPQNTLQYTTAGEVVQAPTPPPPPPPPPSGGGTTGGGTTGGGTTGGGTTGGGTTGGGTTGGGTTTPPPPASNSISLDGGPAPTPSFAALADGGIAGTTSFAVAIDGGNSGVVVSGGGSGGSTGGGTTTPPPAPNGIVVAAAPSGPPTPSGGWTAVMADGFSNQFPLSGLWGPNGNDNGGVGRTATLAPGNANEVAMFNASQVTIDSGGLRLTAIYQQGVGGTGRDYLSGVCISQQFVSGEPGQQGFRGITGFRWLPTAGVTTVFEAVMALPDVNSSPGMDPSFWMSTPSWLDEIDMPEFWCYGTKPYGFGVVWIYNTSTGASNRGEMYGFAPQFDQAFHKWTIAFDGVARTVRVYVDGVLQTALNFNWPASWSSTPLYLILENSMRNVYGTPPTWTTGSRVFRYRSVAVYQDTPHARTGITGGLIAPGTIVQ